MPRSPETLNTVTGPSGNSPWMPTPMPLSKWVSYCQFSTMLNGMVQCAKSIFPVCESMRAGLAWKPQMPVRAWEIIIVRSAGTSPSEAAGMPSLLNDASARQPVFPTAVRRSKHLSVNALRLYFSTSTLSAL